MKNFNKLVFSIQNWPHGAVKSATLDFDEKTIEIKNSTGIAFQRGSEFFQAAKAVCRCKVEAWTSMESPVLEGTVWRLEFYRNEKAVKSVCGINRFPPQFEEFLQTLTPGFRKLARCGMDIF